MHLFVSGINHKRASVEVREKLSVLNGQLSSSITRVREVCGLREAVILSTCNRFEVYGVTDQEKSTPDFIRPYFTTDLGVDGESFRKHFYYMAREEAVDHLLSVVSSLDSMILGENQILHQVKEAYRVAGEQNATGKMLGKLFQKALEIGKRVRSETAIGHNAVSVSYAAVELARRIFGKLEGKTAMVVGVGEMSQLTLQHLVDQGVRQVLVANRTYQSAVNLAQKYGGEAVEFDDVPASLVRADIVISSTGAPGFVIGVDPVTKALSDRMQKPVLMIDIAVPRDVDPDVANISNVYLYNIDDLQSVVDRNVDERQKAAAHAREIVKEGSAQFVSWIGTLRVAPIIEGLMLRADEIAEAEVARIMGKLEGLSDAQLQAVRSAVKSTTGKLMHAPMTNLKRLSREDRSGETLELVRDLFELKK